jgi:phage protein D
MVGATLSVDVDGVPVSGVFFERLVSLSITDREGIRTDTLSIVFNDAAPHFASPRRGAVVNVTITQGDAPAFVGSYVIDTVSFNCLPYTITIGGHSADLRSQMKASKSRHWDQISVRALVSKIAGEHELEAKISAAVSGHVYSWLAQQDESDLSFLERVARQHGALFTIKKGVLLWLERGAGETANGAQVPAAVLTPQSIVLGSCRVSETDVDRFAAVKAFYQNRAGAKREEVLVSADGAAVGTHTLRAPFSSEAAAQAAAEAYAREMLRGLVQTSCTVVGRPDLMAGQAITYLGVRPSLDGLEFITERVTHSYTKSSGLRTSLEAQLKSDRR